MEWKQVFGEVFEAMAKALKPSLVEWKPTKSRRSPPLHQALETFLGGMETSIGSSGIVPPATLKPSLVEWKPRFFCGDIEELIHLETFLGGMET